MADVILRLHTNCYESYFEIKKRDKQTNTQINKHTNKQKIRGKHKLSTDFNIFMIEVKNVSCRHEIIAVRTHYR